MSVQVARPAGASQGSVPTPAPPQTALTRRPHFFENEEISDLVHRAADYATAGVPVHFAGQAGLGKTALALRVAEVLERPIVLLSGNAGMSPSDLIGREVGFSESEIVDNYIQRVRRTEKRVRADWQESLLAEAMRHGHTVVYDEFTRATPETNATLLSVLEEGVLVASDAPPGQARVEAHPDFRMILTSNPRDYAGVHDTPDALLDRLVTFPLRAFSAETEAGIVASRTGASSWICRATVAVVRALRKREDAGLCVSMRTSLMIARIATAADLRKSLTPARLRTIAVDVIAGRAPAMTEAEIQSIVAAALPDPEEA